MNEESVVLLILFAVAAIPFICLALYLIEKRGVSKRFSPLAAVVLVAFFLKLFVHGSTKPPTPPPQPPAAEAHVVVRDIETRGLTVVPSVEGELREKLLGQTCLVQVKRDAEDWATVLEIPNYNLEPVRVSGVFVSGGAKTIRRLRLYWPFAEYQEEF